AHSVRGPGAASLGTGSNQANPGQTGPHLATPGRFGTVSGSKARALCAERAADPAGSESDGDE
ncbi:MAG: hypothetical protein AAGP08_05765, partial [Pseudomonadota bacterium]